jgi:hypothetical protein
MSKRYVLIIAYGRLIVSEFNVTHVTGLQQSVTSRGVSFLKIIVGG